MIDGLLPGCVSSSESRSQYIAADTLYPEEAAVVRNAVLERRQEFTAVRACARLALAGLGLPPAPVLPGPRGEPLWPAGVVGSMTHCAGYRAAVQARSTDLRSLGIDAEPHQPLPDGVLEAIALPAERARTAVARVENRQVHWDRLLFSAKESVYKTWFPLTHRPLDFDEASIVFGRVQGPAAGGSFSVRLLTTDPAVPSTLDGRWLVSDGVVLTAIAVPAVDRAANQAVRHKSPSSLPF